MTSASEWVMRAPPPHGRILVLLLAAAMPLYAASCSGDALLRIGGDDKPASKPPGGDGTGTGQTGDADAPGDPGTPLSPGGDGDLPPGGGPAGPGTPTDPPGNEEEPPGTATPSPSGGPFNYAEALQKALLFYDAEKSGTGITGGRLQWRGDSEVADARIALQPMDARRAGTNLSAAFIARHTAVLDPDGDGSVDLGGGFHDAGDHVKFGLPQAYSASTLGWSFYEFRGAFERTHQDRHMLEILRWFNDYFLRSTFLDAAGEVVAFAYQVGEGSIDHNYWGPPELQRPEQFPRPAYFATAETPASDQAAAAAASLAIMSLNDREERPSYAAQCLRVARALYVFAVAHRGLGYSGGFYNSSYDEDELAWAAVWLHLATGEQGYLEDVVATSGGVYTGYLSRIMTGVADGWQNTWVHCWDTVWGGVFVKLFPLTRDPKHEHIARWNLEYWSGIPHEDANDTAFLAASPAGFRVLSTWGSARYNAAAELCALVFHKSTGRAQLAEWARGQMDYIMGKNPLGRSYIVGFTGTHAEHPHHRAAHGSATNSMLDPPAHRHVLWGALVGGPDINDRHVDETADFVYNEVAIDYNAGLVGALAGLLTYYGDEHLPLADFPPAEPAVEPFFAEAKLEQENGERTQLTITLRNASVHPPHFEDGLSARYFFDISELVAAGQGIEDVAVEVMYDESATSYDGPVAVRGPLAWDASRHLYYVELDWAGYALYGGRRLQLALVARQDGHWRAHWDASNDFSREGVGAEAAVNPRIPVYVDGEKVFGLDP